MIRIWIVYIICLIAIAVFLLGCEHDETKVGIPTIPEAPIAARWDGKRTEAKQWNEHLVTQIKKSNLLNTTPQDIGDFCGKYKGNELRFWVYLVSSIAQLESNFKPDTTFKENFKNSRGEWIISTGLLQLSWESSGGYGYKVTTEQLKNPLLNLEIGTVILDRWVTRDGVIASTSSPWKGASRFWSVMRPAKLSTIRGWTQAFCSAL